MKLERLDIHHLPGLDGPVSIRFEPKAINFITGPNASGKSSIVRAVRALLYPDQSPGFCHLQARWLIGEEALDCERHGEQVSWLKDGQAAPPPPLPGNESVGAFLISSEDLVRFGDTEAHIAGQIRTLLAGGFDLDTLLSGAPLQIPPRPQGRARELARLSLQIDEKQAEYADLQDKLDTLDELQHELAATGDAAGELRACEDALAMADALSARTALEHTLIEEFDGGMDRLRGDEIDRIEQIDEQIAQRRKELNLENQTLAQAETRLAEIGNVDPEQLEAVQAGLAEQRDQLGALEQRIEKHVGELERAIQEQQAVSRRLGSGTSREQPELPLAELEKFERQVDRILDQREKVRGISADLARLHVPRAEALASVDALRQARDALVDWLKHARLSELEGLLWGGLSLTAAVAAWRLLGPRELDPVGELILLILIAVGLPLSLLVRFIQRYRFLGQARTRYLSTEIEEPLGWSESEVEARLERLEEELEASTHRHVQQKRAGELHERLNDERAHFEEARARLEAQAQGLGLEHDARLETGFLLWARQLHDWQRADSSVRRHRHELDQARAAHETGRGHAAELMQNHGIEADARLSSKTLSGVLHQLVPRMRTNAELHNRIQASRRRQGEIKADIEGLTERQDQIFTQAGIKPGDRNTLAQRCARLKEWQRLEQQRRDLGMEVARLELKLERHRDLLKQAREQQRDELDRRQQGLAAQVERRDELNRRIATLRTRHDELLRRRELTALSGKYETQRQTLSEELERHLLANAGQALVEDVRIAHQAENEPAALSRATAWLERFTRHRYRLRFRGDRFEVFDARSERIRPLAELSTASRAQLLLALRLAWIEQAEQHRESLPVFMDEVLTTSDPDRYRLVVESIQEISRSGRQMFYLTAQSGEAAAWSEWAGDGHKPHVIDMAEVRRGQIEPLKLSMPSAEHRRRDVPDPGKFSPEDWARQAGIGPINPWLGTGMVEVFHLLHDRLELAASLIRVELGRVGELGGYLERVGATDRLLEPEQIQLLKQRCTATALILDDWRARHNRPVDAAALATFGQISEAFMERVVELLDEVGGQPDALLEALREGRVSRFRTDTSDALEQWLRESHYLSARREAAAMSAAELAHRSGLEPETAAKLREWIVSAIYDPLAQR